MKSIVYIQINVHVHVAHTITIPISEQVFPPGQPTMERAGPLLLAPETNTIPCLSTRLVSSSRTRLGG